MKKQVLITEISESDFRKLDLKGRTRRSLGLGNAGCISINEELTKILESALRGGYQADLETVCNPVTVAIHEEPTEADDGFYYDKYMNAFGEARNYAIGVGIKHLYSTRDYLECREDYWRVPKSETKVVYRIHLDESWANKFVLKHRRVEKPWPFGDDMGGKITLVEAQDLNDDGSWRTVMMIKRTAISEHAHSEVMVNPEGKEPILCKD